MKALLDFFYSLFNFKSDREKSPVRRVNNTLFNQDPPKIFSKKDQINLRTTRYWEEVVNLPISYFLKKKNNNLDYEREYFKIINKMSRFRITSLKLDKKHDKQVLTDMAQLIEKTAKTRIIAAKKRRDARD